MLVSNLHTKVDMLVTISFFRGVLLQHYLRVTGQEFEHNTS